MVWKVDERIDPDDYHSSWAWWTLAVVVLALACMCSCSHIALAEEGQQDTAYQIFPVDDEVRGRLDDISNGISGLRSDISTLNNELTSDSSTGDKLDSINSTLQVLVEQGNGEVLQETGPIRAAGSITSVAVGNVSPTSQYAEYARGMLPRLGWSDNYVLWQDGQSSYTFAYGPLQASDGAILGSSCNYIRWYWSGNSQGYVVERGTAEVSVTPGAYTVISDLDGWPMLDSGELLRREVMLYALVTVGVFSLWHVLGFTLRVGTRTVS